MSGADGREAAAFEPRALSLSLASVAVFRRVADGPVLAPLAAFLACEGAPLTRVRRYGAFLAALYEAGGDLGAYLIDAALTDDNACIRALAAGGVQTAGMQRPLWMCWITVFLKRSGSCGCFRGFRRSRRRRWPRTRARRTCR